MKTLLFIILLPCALFAQSHPCDTSYGWKPKTSAKKSTLAMSQDADKPLLPLWDGLHLGLEYGRNWDHPFDSQYGLYGEAVFNIPLGGLYSSFKLIYGNDFRYRFDLSKRIF